ncbi:hypothetical protein ES704_03557 [subsurface metagenome]|jgi:hypothetical protein
MLSNDSKREDKIEIDMEKLLNSTEEELSNFTKEELKERILKVLKERGEDPKMWAFERYLKNFK